MARAAQQDVVAGPGRCDRIIAAATVDVVVAVITVQRVAIAEGGIGRIGVAIAAKDDVVIGGAVFGDGYNRRAVIDHHANARCGQGRVKFRWFRREIDELDIVELIHPVAVQNHMIRTGGKNCDAKMIDSRQMAIGIPGHAVLIAQATEIDVVEITAGGTAVDGVVAAAGNERIVAGAGIAFHAVIAGPRIERVVAAAATSVSFPVPPGACRCRRRRQTVLAGIAFDVVGAVTAIGDIVAGPTKDGIAVVSADDVVVSVSERDIRVVAVKDVEARAAIDVVVAIAPTIVSLPPDRSVDSAALSP